MKTINHFESKIFRRNLLLVVFLINIFFDLYSQSEQFLNLPQYLLSEFSTSTIKMKVGKNLTLLLNYNMVTGKMVFFQKDQVFDMINPESVDTIFMENRKFIPVGKVFHEVLLEKPLSLYIDHKGSLVDPGKPAAYGGTSQVSSSTYITRLDMGSSVYNMKLPEDLKVKYDPTYWLTIKGEKYSFLNERQLDKIFPGKEDEIKAFIKKNRLKFENPLDVKKLVSYCSRSIK